MTLRQILFPSSYYSYVNATSSYSTTWLDKLLDPDTYLSTAVFHILQVKSLVCVLNTEWGFLPILGSLALRYKGRRQPVTMEKPRGSEQYQY